MVKEIPLQNGMFALVDDEDFERVNQHLWSVRTTDIKNGLIVENNKVGRIQRFVLGLKDKEKKIIQINKNPLDFTKDNLKILNKSEVQKTAKGWRNSSSKYKGVSWMASRKRWRAHITLEGKFKHLGYFEKEDDAAEEYNKAALSYFGELAFQNIIGQDNSADTFNEVKTDKPRRSQNNQSGYRGVFLHKGLQAKGVKCFTSKIRKNGKCFSLGYFNTAEEAAKAHDKLAYELFGNKAILNFPNEI